MNKSTIILFASFLFFSVFSAYTVNAQEFSKDKINSTGFISDSDVSIYPNPVTNNKLFVKSEKVIKSVEVLNILGQNLKTIHNETNVTYNIIVELGELKKGMYMVRVTFKNNQSIIRKIILK